MRGRNRGKSPNNLNRSFESNGPDVKVRGTAAHIAEKYVQLARDAQSSGDPILAESYLQHAEHYFRMLAAAQAQFGTAGYDGDEGDEGDDAEFEGRIPGMPQQQPYGGFAQPAGPPDEQPRFPQPRRFDEQRQPQERGEPDQRGGGEGYRPDRFQAERNGNGNRFRGNDRYAGERPPREDRFQGGERPPREDRFQGGERPPREDRFQGGERPPREDRFQGGERPPREDRFQGGERPPREDRFQGGERPPREERFQGGERPPREDRFQGGERPPREDRFQGGERPEGETDRPQFQRPGRNRQNDQRFSGDRAPERPSPAVVGLDQPQPIIADERALAMLPSFITGVAATPPAVAPAEPAPVEGEGEARFPLRNRRRRTPKAAAADDAKPADPDPAAE
jgi:hypothetical protein